MGYEADQVVEEELFGRRGTDLTRRRPSVPPLAALDAAERRLGLVAWPPRDRHRVMALKGHVRTPFSPGFLRAFELFDV